MGIFDFLGKKSLKKKSSRDIVEQKGVKEHLEEISKRKLTLYSRSGYGTLIPLRVEEFDGKHLKLRSHGSYVPGKVKENIVFEYEKGGWRYRMECEVKEIYEEKGILVVKAPKCIRDNERRRVKRSLIPPRKREYVKCLSGLGGGIGISGPLRDISELGFCMYIEKMVDLAKSREIRVSMNLLEKGKEFPIVRFKVPGSKEVEGSSKIVYIKREGSGIRVGMEFKKLTGVAEKVIKNYKKSY